MSPQDFQAQFEQMQSRQNFFEVFAIIGALTYFFLFIYLVMLANRFVKAAEKMAATKEDTAPKAQP